MPEVISLGEGTTAISSGVFVTGVRVDGLSPDNQLTALLFFLSSYYKQAMKFSDWDASEGVMGGKDEASKLTEELDANLSHDKGA